MKGLLIAEKPSVMRAIESVYKTLPSPGDTIEFAAFHGHLMALKTPEDYSSAWGSPWSAQQLPIIPSAFAYKAADQAAADALAKKVASGKYDYLVNACDAGREGEHIFWSWYETYGLKLPVKRYWASSNTKPAVKSALNKLLPSAQFDGMRQAAKIRAELDWLIGINCSRAISVATESSGYVGRIMSPVRKMVVDRELEIRNFKSNKFYELKATYETASADAFETTRLLPPQHKEMRHKTRREAETAQKALGPTGKVVRVKEEARTVSAPTLFSQTELQKAANKAYKMPPDKVLEIAQKLYEDGLITYPRTESRYLPTDMIQEIPAHLQVLFNIPDIGPFAKKITAADIKRATTGKAYVDDGRIEDHHAIIPTDEEVDWNKLSPQEQKIYKLVARQFVAIFMPPYRAKTTSVLILNGQALFRCDGTVELDKGYTAIAGTKKGKDIVLPNLVQGDVVTLKSSRITEGETKAPPRYTPDTLLAAMQNAGRFVSDAEQRKILREAAGLGTAATRAPILKKMVARGDLRLENNQYIPSDYSIAFIEHYGQRDFCSPAMTATWEEKLRAMETPAGYKGDLRKEIREYVTKEVEELLTQEAALSQYRFNSVGNCPKCGKRVLSKKSFFTCEAYKADLNPCDFIIAKQVLGITLSDGDMSLILDGKATKQRKLKKKDGTTFTAGFYLNQDKGLGLSFPVTESTKGLGSCPACKKGIIQAGKKYYVCSERSKGCTFLIGRTINGAELTEKDVETLLSGGTTRQLTFTWKSGKTGQAALRLKDDGKLDWIFA